jgi:hypothetical protein
MSPVGLETKNHCAGEGHQQFSSQDSEWGKVDEDGQVENESGECMSDWVRPGTGVANEEWATDFTVKQ